MKTAFFDMTFSEDEGGHYVEIFSRDGKELHTTELADDSDMARADAFKWATKNGYRLLMFGNVAHIPNLQDG